MEFILPSFIAGILTILAPCVLSLLPIILGGSLTEKNHLRPLIVAISLGVSVIIFTLLLKGTAVFLNIPQYLWQILSGSIIIFIGFTMIFPTVWENLAFRLKLYKSENIFQKYGGQGGIKGAIVLGASLGPVFTTCSPTYGIIIATILPISFWKGFGYLGIYTLGLTLSMIAIGYGGRALVSRIKFAANPNGFIKRTFGALILLTGIFIITGFDKKIESAILDAGYSGPIGIEKSLLPNN